MRCLHTSDWHLGHRLVDRDRREEHDRFLAWLLRTIEERKVDLLLLSGDIFDTGTPPNFAQKQYFDFLSALPDTGCGTAVITGGNHDSVSTLQSSSALLSRFSIRIQAGAADNPADEAVAIHAGERLAAVVCAVPYLRERDIRRQTPGENWEAREQAVYIGIQEHYAACIAAGLRLRGDADVPLIAMGHLFATGCRTTEEDHRLYVGNLGRVGAEIFDPAVDYVALGHLHLPQVVGGRETVRYSGAPLEMSFGEEGAKSVTLIDFQGAAAAKIETIPIPRERRLYCIEGRIETVREELIRRDLEEVDDSDSRLKDWIEVRLEGGADGGEFAVGLDEAAESGKYEILRVKVLRPSDIRAIETEAPGERLADLTLEEIFRRKLETEGERDEDGALARAFAELVNCVREGEVE